MANDLPLSDRDIAKLQPLPAAAGAGSAVAGGEPHYAQTFLSTALATESDRYLAWVVVTLSACGFAAALPFAQIKLLQIDAFIPAYEAALILIAVITAVMLFGQARWSRSPALVVLAAGYVYDACLIVPHALSFPGAFSPNGLLGGGQTTAWLFCFWHGGFPLFVIAYSLFNQREAEGVIAPRITWVRGGVTLALTIAIAGALTLLALNHEAVLPTLMNGNTHTAALTAAVSATWVLGLVAIAVVWLQRRHTVLDLWLMVMLCAWVFDIALSAIFNHQRFDLGFYAGRAYGLLAASFVLAILLTETGGLHSRLAGAKALVDAYAHRLEDRVRERTAELAQANETLVSETAERRKIEERLHQSQKMEALGQLTGGLAHDFNNHLAIIIGNLDLLNDTTSVDADQKDLIGDALAAAFNGADLTRRLLAFARRQPLRPANVDVNHLLTEITKLLRRTLGERVEIALDFDPAVPSVLVDPVQLETAIANLANNARDAMPNGGRLTLTTRTGYLDADYAADHPEVTPGRYLLIEVSDTGTGMSPDTVSRAFEPFFTTKEPGKGTGLGLSMVFGFIKQSGGHISIYSEPGRGTTFRLYLPEQEVAADAKGDDVLPLDEIGGRGERILVVEDNAKLRGVLARQLVELGYRVDEAENGVAALAMLDAGLAVDLLLTDIVMPGAPDGLDLARAFVERRPGVRVLLMSGFPGARLAALDEAKAKLRLLDKPYRRQDLARLLRETFDDPSPPTRIELSLTC